MKDLYGRYPNAAKALDCIHDALLEIDRAKWIGTEPVHRFYADLLVFFSSFSKFYNESLKDE
jgi:hypothetical protein